MPNISSASVHRGAQGFDCRSHGVARIGGCSLFSWLMLTALMLLAGCAGLPVDYERTESHALQDTGGTRLAQASQAALAAHPGQNAFRPLPDGRDALLARIHLAEAAERSLDLMYFVWQNDLVGRHLIHALLRAADRGVRVRLILDDYGSKIDDDTLMALDAHPHIEVRLFNPIASRHARFIGLLTDFQRVNRRMHNKAFIADNQRAILGGRNVGDEYFDAHEIWNFEDLDVLTAGPVVSEVSATFDLFWNASVVYPIQALTGRRHDTTALDAMRARLSGFVEAQRDNAYGELARSRASELLAAGNGDVFWGEAHLLFDDPAKITRSRTITEGHLLPRFTTLAQTLDRELLVVSPYFVPGGAGVGWLTGLVQRGVSVTVLTNSLASTDVLMVHSAYKRYRAPLAEGGVRLYELRPDAFAVDRRHEDDERIDSSEAALHAKSFFFDRRQVFIGSLNLDPRAIQLNTEIGIVCDSPAMTESLLARLESRLERIAWRVERIVDDSGSARIVWLEAGEQGVRQRMDEPEVSTWRRLKVWFLGLLPIESQL